MLKLYNSKQSNIIVRLKKENIIERQIAQECVVCFESICKPGTIKILECGHVFHDECIRILEKCPIDRSVLDSSASANRSTITRIES